jgi:putative transposase
MPRVRRITEAKYVYHVFNRAVKGLKLFDLPTDYYDFQLLMRQAQARTPIRILAYCLMPNHWHLLLWPLADGDLSVFMKWLCTSHAARWNKARGLTGRGAVYQSRFKSVPIQHLPDLLRVWRYIERNPLTAELVPQAEAWKWGSLWGRLNGHEYCTKGPVDLPANWVSFVNAQHNQEELRLVLADDF